MNEHDSEIMAGMLTEKGFRQVGERSEADVAIINTCSIRENADKRFFGTLGQLKRRKKDNPEFLVCVCGCMMQQQHVIDTIKAKYPWVDVIFGTLQYPSASGADRQCSCGKRNVRLRYGQTAEKS